MECYGLLITDVDVERALIRAYNSLRPIEQFIFLQQYGFCSNRYKDLSVRQLSSDSDFVRMAIIDKVAMCNLEYGTIEVQRPRINGFETRKESMIVPATFYLKERFINNTRKKCKDVLMKEFLEANLTYSQCLHNLDDICMQLWHELEDEYLIRKE